MNIFRTLLVSGEQKILRIAAKHPEIARIVLVWSVVALIFTIIRYVGIADIRIGVLCAIVIAALCVWISLRFRKWMHYEQQRFAYDYSRKHK